VNSWGKVFTLALVAAFRMAGSFSLGTTGGICHTAVVNVSAGDLLAQPVGANWTSYNGDYTGRRFSSLHEINPQNVAQLRAAGSSILAIPKDSRRLRGGRQWHYVTSPRPTMPLLWMHERDAYCGITNGQVSSGLLDDAAAHHNLAWECGGTSSTWKRMMPTCFASMPAQEICYGTLRTRTRRSTMARPALPSS